MSQSVHSKPQAHLIMWCYNFHAGQKMLKDRFDVKMYPQSAWSKLF